MIKYAILLLLGLTINVGADEQKNTISFEPVYAYQQKNITFDSLSQEINQFQNLASWYSILGEIESKRLERNISRQAFERGQKLFDRGSISRSEFLQRKFRYEKCQALLAEMESRAEMTRVSAEIARFGMQQNGDEQLDFRRQIAGKMRESLQHQVQAMEKGLASVRLSEALLKEEMEQARILHEKGSLPAAELEKRETSYFDVRIQVESLGNQIQVINQAIEGFNKSLERLFGEAPKGARS